MSGDTRPFDAERVENVLRTSEFFRSESNRRSFLGRTLAAGGGVALGAGGALLGGLGTVFADGNPVADFANAAVGAERIGIAFYQNALGITSQFGVAGDVAKGTLLNSGHREYFMAAANQETDHLTTLTGLGFTFPFSTFAFPAGTFASAGAMLAFGEKLESVFIGAYLGAVNVAASTSGAAGVAELAAQIMGIECEHRVLIRDINGEDPPNDRFYEGNQAASTTATLGNTGTRSTVYATAADAVNALLALGITVPS